jgi:hypothetical protein
MWFRQLLSWETLSYTFVVEAKAWVLPSVCKKSTVSIMFMLHEALHLFLTAFHGRCYKFCNLHAVKLSLRSIMACAKGRQLSSGRAKIAPARHPTLLVPVTPPRSSIVSLQPTQELLPPLTPETLGGIHRIHSQVLATCKAPMHWLHWPSVTSA